MTLIWPQHQSSTETLDIASQKMCSGSECQYPICHMLHVWNIYIGACLGVNVGIHITAPWFVSGIYVSSFL